MAVFANRAGARRTRGAALATTNHAGGAAHRLAPRLEIATLVLSSMLADRFYAPGSQDAQRVQGLVAGLAAHGDARFAAQAALYARHQHGLRSITHVVAGEVGRVCQGQPWGRRFFDRIIRRPDDATEIVGYTLATYGGLPNAMKRGFAKALVRFDAHQIAKYRGDGHVMKLVDVVNLCHPKGPEGSAIAHLVKGTIAPADTWERALSEAGSKAQAEAAAAAAAHGDAADGETQMAADLAATMKGAAWVRLLAERKLGYLACLRNLRNIVQQAPEAIEAACALIADPAAIRKSLVFPFQLAAAADALRGIGGPGAAVALAAVSRATDLALGNVPDLPGRTLVAVDDSGSMTQGQGPRRPIDIAALFAAVLVKRLPGADLMLFSDEARYRTVDTTSSVLGIAREITHQAKAAGTNFHAIFQAAGKTRYDRVIILSDMQGWMGVGTPDGAFDAWKARSGCDPYVYALDLNGHGTAQLVGDKVCTLAGWSDRVFEVMRLVEQDREALIAAIEAVEL
jgi:60 kDa SS-A/Ro ribonucleoprotein